MKRKKKLKTDDLLWKGLLKIIDPLGKIQKLRSNIEEVVVDLSSLKIEFTLEGEKTIYNKTIDDTTYDHLLSLWDKGNHELKYAFPEKNQDGKEFHIHKAGTTFLHVEGIRPYVVHVTQKARCFYRWAKNFCGKDNAKKGLAKIIYSKALGAIVS